MTTKIMMAAVAVLALVGLDLRADDLPPPAPKYTLQADGTVTRAEHNAHKAATDAHKAATDAHKAATDARFAVLEAEVKQLKAEKAAAPTAGAACPGGCPCVSAPATAPAPTALPPTALPPTMVINGVPHQLVGGSYHPLSVPQYGYAPTYGGPVYASGGGTCSGGSCGVPSGGAFRRR